MNYLCHSMHAKNHDSLYIFLLLRLIYTALWYFVHFVQLFFDLSAIISWLFLYVVLKYQLFNKNGYISFPDIFIQLIDFNGNISLRGILQLFCHFCEHLHLRERHLHNGREKGWKCVYVYIFADQSLPTKVLLWSRTACRQIVKLTRK